MGTLMAGDIAFLFSALYLLFCVGFRCFAVAFDETQTWPVVDNPIRWDSFADCRFGARDGTNMAKVGTEERLDEHRSLLAEE